MEKKESGMDLIYEFGSSLTVYKIEPFEKGRCKFVKTDRTDRVTNAREFIKIYDFLNAQNIKYFIEEDDIYLEN